MAANVATTYKLADRSTRPDVMNCYTRSCYAKSTMKRLRAALQTLYKSVTQLYVPDCCSFNLRSH